MFKKINGVVKILVITNFFLNSASGSFMPIFAIFITSRVNGGSAAVAGMAISVYWIVKSLFQLPIARFLDKTDGERDDFWAMFLGYLLSGFVPLAFIFVTEPWQLYLVQGFHGFVMAWVVPAWYGIFTRHVDKWRISFEWSLESVFSTGLATAIAAALGGYVADQYGFDALYVVASAVSILATFLLLRIRPYLLPRHNQERVIPEKSAHRS